jgi:hypothetical protein
VRKQGQHPFLREAGRRAFSSPAQRRLAGAASYFPWVRCDVFSVNGETTLNYKIAANN